MKTKLFEIRDRGTFMLAMATLAKSDDRHERYLLSLSGFGHVSPLVVLHFLERNEGHWDPYHWRDRTMSTAHKYIQQNWDVLKSSDVIDVEYILGETTEPKMSRRMEGIGGYCLDTF
jgi:hypothetical protein